MSRNSTPNQVTKPPASKRNPVAKALRTPRFKPKVVKDKKKYTRKNKAS